MGTKAQESVWGGALRNEIWGVGPRMDGWRSLERIEFNLGNVIPANLRKRAPQGSARFARRPSPPLTCALAAAQWQLRRAAKPLAGVQTNPEIKENFRKLLPLTSCLHGRVKSRSLRFDKEESREVGKVKSVGYSNTMTFSIAGTHDQLFSIDGMSSSKSESNSRA